MVCGVIVRLTMYVYTHTHTHTAQGLSSAAWADKEIKVKYGLRAGCTIAHLIEAEREVQGTTCSPTQIHRQQPSPLLPGSLMSDPLNRDLI